MSGTERRRRRDLHKRIGLADECDMAAPAPRRRRDEAAEEAKMAIKRMNHAVLYVRDADRTYAFYRDVLGFRQVGEFPGAKFLQAPDSTNDHDLALFSIGM